MKRWQRPNALWNGGGESQVDGNGGAGVIRAIGATFTLKLGCSDSARVATRLLQVYIRRRHAKLYLSAAEDRQKCRRHPAAGVHG